MPWGVQTGPPYDSTPRTTSDDPVTKPYCLLQPYRLLQIVPVFTHWVLACCILTVSLSAIVEEKPAAPAQTFYLVPGAEHRVRFEASHTFGTADGTLNVMEGQLIFDPQALEEGMSGRFTADVSSFDSGIGLRDRHMKNDYLETDTYPTAVFELDDARPTILKSSTADATHIAVAGTMTLHGVTRKLPVRAELVANGDQYTITSSFSIRLTDFNIDPPRWTIQRVQDEVDVTVEATVEPGAAPAGASG